MKRFFIAILLLAYSLLMFYMLFIGFGREKLLENEVYGYNLIPFNTIGTLLPTGYFNFYSWFIDFANLVAFVPFGLLIPILFRCGFFKFIILFLVSITAVEIAQMLTYRGRFDIDDVILNSLGATIGYLGYQIGSLPKNKVLGVIIGALSVLILSLGMAYGIDRIGKALAGNNELVGMIEESIEREGNLIYDKVANR